jgi:hypothetical protein
VGRYFFDQEIILGGTAASTENKESGDHLERNHRPSVAKPCFGGLHAAWLVQSSFDSALEKFRYRTLILFLNQLARARVAVIRVYDDAGNVIEMQEHKGDFKEW